MKTMLKSMKGSVMSKLNYLFKKSILFGVQNNNYIRNGNAFFII